MSFNSFGTLSILHLTHEANTLFLKIISLAHSVFKAKHIFIVQIILLNKLGLESGFGN